MNIGKLLSTKLIKTNLPPTDKYFPFQLLSFFLFIHQSFFNLCYSIFYDA
jgi:hypothetical protein